jgi:hypothetical protein
MTSFFRNLLDLVVRVRQDPAISSLRMNVFQKIINISSLLLLLVVFLLQGPLVAGQTNISDEDSVRSSQSGIYPLPIIFYTPETGFAGGAAALFLHRDPSVQRASSITGTAIYTEKKQIILSLSGDAYFSKGATRLLGEVTFQKYPNKFFGVGNNTVGSNEETYTPKTYLLKAVLYRNFASHINIGPILRFENVSMREIAPGGVLATGVLPGSWGGRSSGLGLVANWDSRDNTFSARSGSFYQLTTLFYRSALGSDYSYNDIQIDTRNFFNTFSDHVLATQGCGEFIDGSVPFQNYAKFGGQSLLRGYFDGRFRDKNAVSFQAEYRIPVWWRFGLVGFAGIAQVADRIKMLAINRFWFAGGIGLRFAWSPDERINLRLDYGVGNNSSGLYITVTEAF